MPNVTQPQEEKFDLRTHRTDPITGETKMVNQYRLHILNGVRYFERPVGSGNLWFENNQPAGRLVGFTAQGAKVDLTEAHKAYTPPPTGAERIAAELAAKDAALAQAHAELAAIKAERDAKVAPPSEPKSTAGGPQKTPNPAFMGNKKD